MMMMMYLTAMTFLDTVQLVCDDDAESADDDDLFDDYDIGSVQ